MNWYKFSQVVNTESMDIHPQSRGISRNFVADDDSGDSLQLLVIPVMHENKGYITVQLDAVHGGIMPKSPQLNKLKEALLASISNVASVKFVDDHFDPMEAKLPTGAYKVSKMEGVFGPVSAKQIEDAIRSMENAWSALGDRMIDLDLISYYSIKNNGKTIAEKISKSERGAAEKIMSSDSDQMKTFMCRMERFSQSHPELSAWIKEMNTSLTDWAWGAMHGSRYKMDSVKDSDCNGILSDQWIARFGDQLVSPSKEIFFYICGRPRKNHETVMSIISGTPADAMSKNGIDQFIEYLIIDDGERYLNDWINSLSRNRSMFSKSILSHPWAVFTLDKSHSGLAEKLKKIQENK